MKIKHLIIIEIIFFLAFMGFSSTNAVKEAIKGVCKKISSYFYNPSTSSDENFTSFACTGPNEPFEGCEKIRNAKAIDDNKDENLPMAVSDDPTDEPFKGRNCLSISYGKFITDLQQKSSAYPKMPTKETPFYAYNEVVQNAKTPQEIKEQAQIAFITVLQKMKLSDKFSGLISETILDLCLNLNENQACTEYQKGKMLLRTQLEVLYLLYLSKNTRVGHNKYHFVKLCGEFSRGENEIEGIPPFICYGADKPFSGCEKIRDAKEIDDEKDENIPMVDSDDPTKEPFKGRNCLQLSYRAFVSSLQQKTPVILSNMPAKETPLYTYDLLTQNVKTPGEIKEQVQMAFSTIVKDMKLGDNYAGFICETITDLCSALNRDQTCTEYQKEKMLIRTQIEAVYQVYSQINNNVNCKESYFTHHCGEFSTFMKNYDTSSDSTDLEESISDNEDEIPSQISPFKCKGPDNPFVGCKKIKKAKKIDDEREENLPMDNSEDLTKEPFKGRNCLRSGYESFFLGLQNKSESVMDMESEKRPYYIFSINAENASTPQEIKQEAQRMFSFILKKKLRTNMSDTICGTILNLCKDLQKEDACVNYQQSKMLLRTQLEILYFVYASLRKGECKRERFVNICGPVSAYTNKSYPEIPDPWKNLKF